MPNPPSTSELRDELAAYYGPLLPYWDATLSGRGDLGFWRRRAGDWSKRTLLELGCGNGRVTEVLAGRAGRVVGLDLNLEALREARRRLAGRGNAALLAADMRTFAMGRRFPVLVAANDPFSHLRTDRGRRRAMERASAHLEPGGRLVLDALWLSESWLEEARSEEGKVHEFAPGGEGTGDGTGPELRVRHRWRCPPEGRVCTARFEVWAGGVRRVEATFRGRVWSMEELRRLLSESGLELERLHGDYAGGAWHPDADRLVVEAVRA